MGNYENLLGGFFLRSEEGITHITPSEDNNQYEQTWCAMFGVGKTAEELANLAQEIVPECEIMVEENGVARAKTPSEWAFYKCKTACTVEELLAFNQLDSVLVWQSEEDGASRTPIHTTEELDALIREAKKGSKTLFVELTEDVMEPILVTFPGPVILEVEEQYLVEYKPNEEVVLSADAKKAKVFTKDEAEVIIRDLANADLEVQPLSAAVQQEPFDAVLQVVSKSDCGLYIRRCFDLEMELTPDVDDAKRYANEALAQEVASSIAKFIQVEVKKLQ